MLAGLFVGGIVLNNSASRQLTGLAHDGVLPAAFATRRSGGQPPVAATLVQPIVAGGIALLASITGFGAVPQWLITGAGLGIIGSLTLASAASSIWFLRSEDDERGFLGWEGQVIAGLTSVVTTGGLFLYGVFRLRSVAPDAPGAGSWLIGVLILGLFGAGALTAVRLRSTRPEVYQAIGKGLDPSSNHRASPAPRAWSEAPRGFDRSRH